MSGEQIKAERDMFVEMLASLAIKYGAPIEEVERLKSGFNIQDQELALSRAFGDHA